MKGIAFACAALLSLAAGAVPLSAPWAENRIVFGEKKPRSGVLTDERLKAVGACGMNGVWLRVKLREVANTCITRRTEEGERDLAYLRDLVRRAGACGVKVWIFGNEPWPFGPDDPLLKEHPELGGQTFSWYERRMWCPSEPLTLKFMEEAVEDVFREVPGLGGFLNISNGEALSTCLDGWCATPMEDGKADLPNCPRCTRRHPWQLHEDVATAVVKGMRRANPSARYLSWFYHPIGDPQRKPWVAECAQHVPDGCTFVYNFESGGLKTQGGRMKCASDYWLSFAGPSAAYAGIAAAARNAGTRLGAKIQTCNSHELATLPYIPAPGLLYRKYRAMHAEKVQDVVQCWYFGGDPSMMLRAAGELSREDFSDGEEAFLRRFARSEWGEDADEVAALWKEFSDAFEAYPFTTSMSYYGPYHNGIVWPLHALVQGTEMPRSWKKGESEAGDRICEACGTMSVDEILHQSEIMRRLTRAVSSDGTDRLAALRRKYAGDKARLDELGVMEAFRIHCAAARDIFRFYRLRGDAVRLSRVYGLHDRARACVAEMKDLCRARIPLAARLDVLASADPRLGWHTEAGAHKYDPETLAKVPDLMSGAIADLDAVDTALARGEPYPTSVREREAPKAKLGVWHEAKGFRWRVDRETNGNFRISADCEASIPRLVFVTADICGLDYPHKFFIPAPGKGEFTEVVEWIESTDCGSIEYRPSARGWAFELTMDAAAWGLDPVREPKWIVILDDTYLPQRKATPIWPAGDPPPVVSLSLIWIKNYRFGMLEP